MENLRVFLSIRFSLDVPEVKSTSLLWALSIAFSSGAVRAAVLNFDDIPVPDPRASVFVPNTYQGFDFTSNTTDSEFFVEPDAGSRQRHLRYLG